MVSANDEVGIYEAKRDLSRLIERAERGETITITRHGKPVAVLGKCDSVDEETLRQERVEAGLEAFDRLRASYRERNKGKPPLTFEEIKGWINEGRQ